MRQITGFAFGLIVILLAAGCIDYTEQIVLDDEGNGTVSLSYKVPSDFISGFGKSENPALADENISFADRFETEGVEVSRTSVIDLNDARVYSADFAFVGSDALDTAAFYRDFATVEITTGKTLEYTKTIPPREESIDKADKENNEKMAYLFKDNLFTFSVKMPARVTASNGTVSEDGFTVEWTYTFGDIVLSDKPLEMTAECRITK